MVGHADERVLIHYAYGDPLAGAEQADPGRVARVELALARLDAAGAPEERVGIHHHLVAGNVGEVEVVHLARTYNSQPTKRGSQKRSTHDIKEII